MSSGSYASSGLNRMGTKSSEPHVWENWSSPQSQPCFYRNKRYNSASEALDAYIRDYEGRLSSALQPQQGVQVLDSNYPKDTHQLLCCLFCVLLFFSFCFVLFCLVFSVLVFLVFLKFFLFRFSFQVLRLSKVYSRKLESQLLFMCHMVMVP